MRYFDLLKERAEERNSYLTNLQQNLFLIKKFFKENLGNTQIYLFGSILRKDFGPDSDVDVLVVSHKSIKYYQKSRLIANLKNIIGFVNPFEIHLVTHKDYKEWYSKFIKEKQKV